MRLIFRNLWQQFSWWSMLPLRTLKMPKWGNNSLTGWRLFLFSEWSLVKLGSLVKLFKDLWEWNQDSTANLHQSAAKVWRKMRGTQQTDETVSWEEMSRFVYVFHPVTYTFRFHECLVDEVSGQVSTKTHWAMTSPKPQKEDPLWLNQAACCWMVNSLLTKYEIGVKQHYRNATNKIKRLNLCNLWHQLS